MSQDYHPYLKCNHSQFSLVVQAVDSHIQQIEQK
jgi:hypothetical protein